MTDIVKKVIQPSKLVNFKHTVPVERSLYKEDMQDNPHYWESEYGYLGDAMGDASSNPPSKPWYDQLITLYGAYQANKIATRQQDQLARENTARAIAGRPPIPIEQYMRQSAPQVNVGLSDSTTKLLMYGGLGLGGILLFSLLNQKKRR